MNVHPRAVALRAEAALQSSLRVAKKAWTRARAPRDVTAAYLRGRSCHCPHATRAGAFHGVHSEALREACDVVVDFGSNVEAPGRMQLPVETIAPAFDDLPRGASVHVKTDLLGAFVAHVLPRLRVPIVLVTGDSDVSPMHGFGGLLDDPRIAHWFAQNCDAPSSLVSNKLTAIPIGFDNPVYTKLDKRLGFVLTMALGKTPLDTSVAKNDIGDQARMFDVRATLPPTHTRPARALATFHQNQKLVTPDLSSLPDRRAACDALGASPACHFAPRRLRQEECWRAHGEFAFELSPHGNGLDCFRTWEALALGCIPIVKTSPLDRLYREHDFPVVVVDSWADVTETNLQAWKCRHQDAFDGVRGAELIERLGAAYWTARIARAQREAQSS